MFDRTTNWLETNWVTPAYAGWLLGGLTTCFFGVATNTMAGWLYVLSGVGVALLGIAAILPARSLKSLTVSRAPVSPVTAGTELEIALTIHNPTASSTSLLQVRDLTPFATAKPITAIEQIPPQADYRWVYRQPTERRGIYQWERVVLRSGAPVGLFWCQRDRHAPALAVVYPQVLELAKCPLIDGLGSSAALANRSAASRYLAPANEGVARSLRPYRYGDSMRLIHWRTSARRGEFHVRELEIDRGGQDLVICLDSHPTWVAEEFEQAVIAACSLYFYASKFPQLHVKLWTAGSGIISGDRRVLETLAAVQMQEREREFPPTAFICLTNQPQLVPTLPPGSPWVLWSRAPVAPRVSAPGIVIDPEQSLQQQLSHALTSDRSVGSELEPPLATANFDFN